MSISKAEYMLKYQKAKVKLLEYDVPENDKPRFRLNYRELAFPTILAISEYADAVISDDFKKQIELKEALHFSSEFYDAAVKSREQVNHDMDFLLIGAAAYFFQENFGNAMVLLSSIDFSNITNDERGVLAEIFELIFYGKTKTIIDDPIIWSFKQYLVGGNEDEVLHNANERVKDVYQGNDETKAFFSDVICAVIKIALANSARRLLPFYSGVSDDKWNEYFEKQSSVKMIWPAQRIIGEKGILKGKNGIVQLPTGVGKTKSIELMIRSMFFKGRGNTALIVAPLRALCNEITDDMRKAFGDDVTINQFSDLLEMDFGNIFDENSDNTIVICTPEKLMFILHHNNSILSELDLIVFDEGHLFDDMSRGALYELLISNIKDNLTGNQQIVLLSAVLPNADEIIRWVAGEEGVLAYDENIKSTPKVIGFASKAEEVHYYSTVFDEEDFYIPRAIRRTELAKKSNLERIKRFFPENNAQDIALYFTNKLCKNGGIAIYVAQRRSIPKLLARVIDLEERGYCLSEIENNSDKEELEKLKYLIEQYYGSDYVYTRTVLKGILPHYSTLPNGMRLSVEYAFRKGMIKAVVCTSTLAQGINIPIKYLIMTSLRSAQNRISIRNFQNLIGRTARSGVYTEGSIIIADPDLYDKRESGRGYYNWQEATSLFQPQNAEACGSAILSIVKPFIIDYETVVSGKSIVKGICEHISEEWDVLIVSALTKWLERKGKATSINIQTVSKMISDYKNIIGNIENEICHLMEATGKGNICQDSFMTVALHIYDKSLAHVLADAEEDDLLKQLFLTIASHLASTDIDVSKIAISMTDIELSSKICAMIKIYHLDEDIKETDDLLRILVELYNEVYPDNPISEELCSAWINGENYKTIATNFGLEIIDAEQRCGQNLSYQFSFIIGNVIDYIDDASSNAKSLGLLQKQIKYGVRDITSIAICESIVNDRMVAKVISKVLEDSQISSDRIKKAIIRKKNRILEQLIPFPSYFSEKVKTIV